MWFTQSESVHFLKREVEKSPKFSQTSWILAWGSYPGLVEKNDDRPTSLLPSSFFCSCFRFLSTHSSPPPCKLALAVGNKLSCWHFLFAFLHREIPQTPPFNLLWKSPTHCTGSRATSLFLKLIPSTVHILSLYFHNWNPKRCWGKKWIGFVSGRLAQAAYPLPGLCKEETR